MRAVVPALRAAQPASASDVNIRFLIPGLGVLAAWGVLPFGAVHDWALWPLMAGALLVGGAGVVSGGRVRCGWIALASVPLLAAVAVQLLPLPLGLLQNASSATARLAAEYDAATAAGLRSAHPFSVDPVLTWRALAILLALTALTAGIAAVLSRSADGGRRTAASVTTLGVFVALLALAQKATFNGKIYWFWESQFRGTSNYYGPFVNRNHFAGWMLLAVALAAGLLIARLARGAPSVKPGWRDRILWLGSREASLLLLTAAALMVMLTSTLWSMSRSGMAATALALAILGIAAILRLRGSARKHVAIGSLVLLSFTAIAWRGVDTLAAWYGRTQTFDWRVQLWKDTLPALQDFWLFGSGLNTYGTVMLLYPQTDTSVHARQAHSDYIQLAVEGGLLLTIPVLLLIVLFVRTAIRRLRQPQDETAWWIRMGAVAGICGMALQEFSEFSLQIPGVAVLFAVLVAIAIHEPASVPLTGPRRERRSRLTPIVPEFQRRACRLR